MNRFIGHPVHDVIEERSTGAVHTAEFAVIASLDRLKALELYSLLLYSFLLFLLSLHTFSLHMFLLHALSLQSFSFRTLSLRMLSLQLLQPLLFNSFPLCLLYTKPSV